MSLRLLNKYAVARVMIVTVLLFIAVRPVVAQPRKVLSHQKTSSTQGNFTGALDDSDAFGVSAAALGDLDGDGVGDLAVGAFRDDDGGQNRGAVWILFLNTDGTTRSHQKISDIEGGFTGALDNFDGFGSAVTSLGDLDGDGVGDLAVGAYADDDGGSNVGAVWILFLNTDGTVKAHQKISPTQGRFTGTPGSGDPFGNFGVSLASLGDLDGDGVIDLAVGAFFEDDGGRDRGAVWILFLNVNGTVKSNQKISSTQGGFTGILDNGDAFGISVDSMGDFDGDGHTDLVVGAYGNDDGGLNRGAIWILLLNSNGTVRSHQKISSIEGGFNGPLGNGDQFGTSVASLGDHDGDGVGDLAVGSYLDGEGGGARGAAWILLLNVDGTVRSHQKIGSLQEGFTGTLNNGDRFGQAMSFLGDLDGDQVGDLAVSAVFSDDGGTDRGAMWTLFLDGNSCSADCDESTGVGTLDIFDFLCFQDSFVNGRPYACDCDGSTGLLVCDIFDFLCYQGAFVAGCP